MDDDPEPTYDQMIVESHETNDTLLTFGEQKCPTEISEESPLESGDIGPAVDPESPKKTTAVKDLQVQTESKTSIFRRKEWMDQSQQSDLSGSIKSSTTSVRKPSRRGSQRLLGQESRRSSQQSAGQGPPPSQKPPRAPAISEVDTKDPTWVSQRTGKLMKSRCQQTSLVWERKTLSEILCPSSEESIPSKEEESEFTTTEDGLTSSGETAKERASGPESGLGRKQPERKESKPGSQKHTERFGSRRSSQQWNEPPSPPASKSSRVLSAKGMDSNEDVAWISRRTGREMKCQAQQTSQVWEPKAVSSFFGSSRKSSQVGQEESGFSITDEVTSSAETEMEEPTTLDSCYSSQPELGSPDAHWSSQRPTEQPCSLSLNASHEEFDKESETEEEPSWISQRTGKGMTSKSQQTSLVWEHKTLSDVLHVYSKGSEASEVEEEDYSEDEEEEPKTEQEILEDADPHIQSLEEEEYRHDIQQVEEQKPEPQRSTHKIKIDRAQQTDSAESIKKVFADSSQQTDVSEGGEMNLGDLPQDPDQGSEPTDVQGSRRSSREVVRQDSGSRSPPPERRDSQRSRQPSLRSTTEAAEEDEPKLPSDMEKEPPELSPKASSVEPAEETTWVSRKTGRTVKNQGQQTDRSWLQYFAAKSKKLKRCISQQTDESFLQRYKTGKQVFREHRKNHTEPDIRRCALCGDLYGEPFPLDPDVFSSFSTMSILSTISSQEAAREEKAEEQDLLSRREDEEQPQMQQPLPWESQRGSQQADGTEAPPGADREPRRASLQAADDQNWVEWDEEHESHVASESSLLYTEGDNKVQQTYSMISFEDGIWLNRNTGKLLITHGQQTSETAVAKESRTALEKPGSTREGRPAPAEVEEGENWDIQPSMQIDVQPPSGQPSRRGSQQDPDGDSRLLQTQPTRHLRSDDEVQKMVCIRLSEATLLSVESPDMEDGPVQIYTIVSLQEDSWMNLQTGKFLASQSQQTEASSPQSSAEEGESSDAPSQKPPEEGLVDTL